MRAILKPEHFQESILTLTESGLQASFDIEEHDREVGIMGYLGDVQRARKAMEKRLFRYAERGPTLMELNPSSHTPQEVLAHMQAFQTEKYGLPGVSPDGKEVGEDIRLASAFDDGRVGESWYSRLDSSIPSEPAYVQGQKFILTATHDGNLCGFAVLMFGCHQDEEGAEVHLNVDVPLVYVAPKMRRKGFGLDLSLAAGMLAEQFFLATWRACPDGSTLIPSVGAELESMGGKAFVYQVYRALTFVRDMARELPEEFSPEVDCHEVLADFC